MYAISTNKYPSAKFCKHGLGIGYPCDLCGDTRKGLHSVPWNTNQGAYVWPVPKQTKPELKRA